jgi:hypothetical protein
MLARAGTPRDLFPPPELISDAELAEHRTVWLLEGEPDAIRAWSLGLVAIGVPGAGNWRDEWAARFTGRRLRVIVCFDCDQAGRAGATRAAASIAAAGVDARLLELDADRDDGFDLTDFTRDADTADLRRQAAALLETVADRLELYEPGPEPSSEGEKPEDRERPWRSVTWAAFRDTAPPAHIWLIDGLLQAGALVFVAGPPKRGKTWLGIGHSLALALGQPFAGFAVPEPRDVLYIALEGSQTGLRTRIGALARGFGADPDSAELERLHMLYRPRPFDLAELATAGWLVEEAEQTDAALVVVDVLRAAARFDENAAADFARIRDRLDPLLAAGRTVALLHHFGKLSDTQRERSPGERMAGTGAMYGALDVGFLITRSEEGARRLGVTIEARDFAAPAVLNVVISGQGHGKHGGFRYDDEATLAIDTAAADSRDLVGEAAEELAEKPAGLSRDDLATKLKVGWKEIEAQLVVDTERRKELGEPPRLVRWVEKRDGRFPDGPSWNYAPYLTQAAYEEARTAQTSLLDDRSVGSQPSDLAARSEGLGRSLGPPTGDTAGPSDHREPGRAEPSDGIT